MAAIEDLRIDSECDVAAIVFGLRDDPDALLEDFAADVAASGIVVSGVIQNGRCADRRGLTCRLLPSGRTVRLSQELGPLSTACSLDAARLIDAGAAVDPDLLPPGTGLVIFNRFGKLEEQGRGFRDHIANLALQGIPLIIAVAESRFESWNRYVGGLSVKLPCRRSAVDRWWRMVTGADACGVPRDTPSACRDWK